MYLAHAFSLVFVYTPLCLDQEYYWDEQEGEEAGKKIISYSWKLLCFYIRNLNILLILQKKAIPDTFFEFFLIIQRVIKLGRFKNQDFDFDQTNDFFY